MKHQPQLSGIAAALASHGRNGDTELLHVSKSEIAALQALGAPAGIHLTKNPQTGLYEAFNWLGTLGGIAGGIIGTIIAPGAGTAAGAALGSAAGTAAGGGSTKQILTSGIISGVTGFATAGIGNALADVGTKATTEALGQVGGETLGQVGGQSLAEGSSQQLGSVVGDTFVQNGSQAVGQTGGQTLGQSGGQTLAEGSSKGLGSVVGDKFVTGPVGNGLASSVAKGPAFVTMGDKVITDPATQMSYVDKLTAGWDKVTSSPAEFGKFASANAKGIIGTGLGLAGVGSLNPTETTINTAQKKTYPRMRGEMYIDPATGQQRSRAVPMADGGPVFGQYDSVEEAADGGYIPGGGLNYAKGGSAQLFSKLDSIRSQRYADGGSTASSPTHTAESAGRGLAALTGKVLPEGFFSEEDWAKATPEEKSQMLAMMEARKEIVPSPMRRQIEGFDRGGDIRSDLDVTDLESPAAKYVRRLDVRGAPIVDKGVRGAAGRVGYNFPVGDTDNLSVGLSGVGVRTNFPGSDPVTRGQVTGIDATYGTPDRSISARYDSRAPAVMPSNYGPIDAQSMMHMGLMPTARDKFSVSYRQSFNNGGGIGGIGDLGGYSDGGRLLRGPGDGVSDSIPADIEGKRPARLADGEFVIPARAVSELGNGSTEAGSKQLYAMLDRIAAKRKKGKGLAYESNPKKLMPA